MKIFSNYKLLSPENVIWHRTPPFCNQFTQLSVQPRRKQLFLKSLAHSPAVRMIYVSGGRTPALF